MLQADDQGTGRYGFGDTEVGVKVRFLQERDWVPMVGVFPIAKLPSGDSQKGLRSGNVQVFLPVWLQKSLGAWTTYEGGGYWINPGTGNKDYWFIGPPPWPQALFARLVFYTWN